MKKFCAILFAILCINYVSSLTKNETELIQNRNSKRTCGGNVEVVDYNESNPTVTIRRSVTPDHVWGCTNPNTPTASDKTISLSNKPEVDANGPYCLPMGDTGIALNGVSFYNPLAAGGVNAVEGGRQELFDCCGGHTSPNGNYHYHKLPVGGGCDNPIFDNKDTQKPQFLGVALDGFAIYGQWDGLNEDDLDECHGMDISVDGKSQYAYIAVSGHFPYIMGCFKGKPSRNLNRCNNAQKGHLCSCEYGNGNALSYSDVTSDGQTPEQSDNSNINPEETDDKCHNDKCILGGDFYYENGRCTGGNGGGNMPFPGPNGGGPNGNGPNGGGNRPYPGPNGGGPNGGGQNGGGNRPHPGPNGGGPNGNGPNDDGNRPHPGPNGGGPNGNGPNGGGNRPYPGPNGGGPNGGGQNGGGDRPHPGPNGGGQNGNGPNGGGYGGYMPPSRPYGGNNGQNQGPNGGPPNGNGPNGGGYDGNMPPFMPCGGGNGQNQGPNSGEPNGYGPNGGGDGGNMPQPGPNGGNNGQNQGPNGDRPNGGRPNGGRPNGGRPNGGRPNGGRPSDGRPNGGRPNGGRPNGGRPNRYYRPNRDGPSNGMQWIQVSHGNRQRRCILDMN